MPADSHVNRSSGLTHDEVLRYSRHLIMPEVGMEGQERLKAASVLIVGAGGLGSPAAMYLAAAGVGRIGIVDFDRVDDYFNGYALGGGKLKGLGVPTTIIAAQDDPIIPVEDIERIDPVDGLEVEITRYGGHCGFLCDFRMQSWVERRIAELLAG